jgi:hypothetical protein
MNMVDKILNVANYVVPSVIGLLMLFEIAYMIVEYAL